MTSDILDKESEILLRQPPFIVRHDNSNSRYLTFDSRMLFIDRRGPKNIEKGNLRNSIMIRKLNFSALTMILAMVLVSNAVSESGSISGSEEFDRTRLPLMWEPLDRPQISSKQSGSQKLSSLIGAPEVDAVWACSSQWLSGINWGGETFSGSISKGF